MSMRSVCLLLCGVALTWPLASFSQAQKNKKASTTAAVAKTAAAANKTASTANTAGTMPRSPAGVSDSNKALEVRGQTRNLSMMLTLKNRGDNIDFVKPRQNYQSEIKNTGF